MQRLALLTLLAVSWQVHAQTPRFEDYSVTEVFRGTPADPILSEPWMRMYRTKLREGVSKGYGVSHYSSPNPRDPGKKEEGPGPNFAGHYFVINWGCGSDCIQMVIVDGKTGRVHPPPLSYGHDFPAMLRRRGHTISDGANYRIDSKLFVMETCDWNNIKYADDGLQSLLLCTLSYFVIESSGFKLITQVNYDTPL
jgi:hypothetical protein